MNLIPSFQEFEETNPLNGKITPALAESLADYFAGEEEVNEGVFDSIKNTLSKTFLGSLSYINMIDKVRSEVLKLEKELVQKKYSFEDEMDSLKNSIKELSKNNDESGIDRVKKTIDAKTKEYQAHGKMTNMRIEKAISTIKDAIKGSKRRMEYWEAGKSQDELDLAEFEYRVAKQRANTKPEDLKDLESEVKKAKEEAEKAKKQLQDDAKKQEQKEKSFSSDYKESFKSKKGRDAAIAQIEHEIVDLEKELKSTRGSFDRKQIERKISSLKGTKKDIQELDKKSKGKKLIPSQNDFESLNKLAKEMEKMVAKTEEPARTPVGFDMPKSSKETAKEKGKQKAGELKKQEAPAPTSSKVNDTIEKKK